MGTAADFETIEVPNIGSYGRMVPYHKNQVLTNVGANWSVVGYTVPSGRVFALDWAMLIYRSGLAPSSLHILLYDSGGTRQAWPVRYTPSGPNDPGVISNTLWVASGWDIEFLIGGGDATTDVTWSLSGRLFDWTDFAP